MQLGEAQKRTNNLQQISKKEKRQIENVDSRDEFRWRNQESEPWQKVVLKSLGLMQQPNFDALMYDEHRFNRSKREEVVPKYKSASFIIERTMRMKSLNKELKILNLQCYVVKQKVAT